MKQQITRASAPIVAVFESASSIRIIMIDGEPWFVAADVCDVLGYANSRKAIADHCRAGGVTKRDTPAEGCDVTNSYATSKARLSQEMTYINEGNLYRLVIKSRKPEAEKFEAWVCDEVLPSIRKTGRYEVAERQEPEPERGITAEELQQIKLCARGISRYFPSISEEKALMAVYSRMKYEHRIRRIEQFPASRFGESITWLRSIEEKARAHWFAMQRYEAKVMADLGIPLNSY